VKEGRHFYFRDAVEADFAFIVDNLYNTIMRQMPWSAMEHEVLREFSTWFGDTVLPESIVLIAQNPEEPVHALGAIHGYAVAGMAPQALHWAYVRREKRGWGLGSALASEIRDRLGVDEASTLDYTIHTKAVDRLGLRDRWKMRYRPWAMLTLL